METRLPRNPVHRRVTLRNATFGWCLPPMVYHCTMKVKKKLSEMMEENTNKGIEGTGVILSVNHRGNFKSALSDQNYLEYLQTIKSSKVPAVINYGASWCQICSQILPSFIRFSNDFPKISFIYADIDECPETTQHIRYTPTFHFFREGERVDEMIGAGEERLRDRLWLHS